VMRAPSRVFGMLFGGFAGIALVLAAIGLYTVVAHSIAQRTQEIGIRVALGARAPQIRWLVMRRGLAQLAAGLAIGLVGAFGVGILLNGMLGARGNDPVALTVVTAFLSAIAIAACVIPARRAARMNTMTALRCE
jgi:putative ABC transport system permease protein